MPCGGLGAARGAGGTELIGWGSTIATCVSIVVHPTNPTTDTIAPPAASLRAHCNIREHQPGIPPRGNMTLPRVAFMTPPAAERAEVPAAATTINQRAARGHGPCPNEYLGRLILN